jgi:sigma-B regulation protein RsbU (phosphoserine phosphatase)
VTGRARRPATDLMAPPAQADLPARLLQASERASFLAQISRVVSGSMRTDRAADLALDLLTRDLVDWAQLALKQGPVLHCRSLLAGATVEEATVPYPREGTTLLERAMQRGLTELGFVPPTDPDEAIASAVPAKSLRTSLAGIRPVDLLVIPLKARGRSFGTLTVAHDEGSGFDPGAVDFLEDLAQGLATTLDATRMLADSRRVANVLSRDLAPPTLPELPGARLGSYYRVAFEHEALGGDFYDVHGEGDDWTVVVGDVCGKGAEAAVLTGRVRQAVRTAALVDRSPGRVLDLVNRVLVSEGDDTFVTAICARVRRRDGTLDVDLAAAGHPEPYVLRSDGMTVERVEARGTVLGLLEDLEYVEERLVLDPGDTCLLVTDGVHEAPGRTGLFGEEGVAEVLAGAPRDDVTAVVETLALALSNHLGDRPHDDIAILGVQNSREQ